MLGLTEEDLVILGESVQTRIFDGMVDRLARVRSLAHKFEEGEAATRPILRKHIPNLDSPVEPRQGRWGVGWKDVCLSSQEFPDLWTTILSVLLQFARGQMLTKNPIDQTSADSPSGSSWQRYLKLR
jgi:hypothetical protein